MLTEPSHSIYNLALFPLRLVLFPQFPLHLQVFEDRYIAMVSECIERNQPFGVVLIAHGEEVGTPAVPHDVGCVARILAVEKLDGGRMNLWAVGERRFRLLEYAEAELPYLVGRCETLDDLEWPAIDRGEPVRELHSLFARYLKLLAECSGVALPPLGLPDDPTALGFCIAAAAQLPLAEKQRLLAMTDARLRLKSEKRILQHQIKKLETLKSRSEDKESIDADTTRVIVAERLDTSREFWKGYIRDARN